MDEIIDLMYIKRCKKEAIAKTIMGFIQAILICCGVVILLFGSVFFIRWIISIIPSNFTDMISLIMSFIIGGLMIIGIICSILLIMNGIYEIYKAHLKECIERIKLEQKVDDVNG
jgi:hypothetical protein